MKSAVEARVPSIPAIERPSVEAERESARLSLVRERAQECAACAVVEFGLPARSDRGLFGRHIAPPVSPGPSSFTISKAPSVKTLIFGQ